MTKIEELEQKLNEWFKTVSKEEMIKILKEEGFEVIDKESKKEGKWKPQFNEEYWFRDDTGKIRSLFNNCELDNWRINNKPVFQTKEQCKRYWHFMDTVKEKSYEFTELDWRDDDIKKWVIQYDYMINRLVVVDHLNIKQFGMVYFKDEESAQYIIDNFKEELMEYFCISGDNKW